MLASTLVLSIVLAGGSATQAPPAPACRTWQQCRDLALDAAARRDYEGFHDLAWRAMQHGPRNHPELMALLARAQSLSGRPHDALVMLQRLATLGVVTDAAESEDFRRVRALPGWSEFELRVAELKTSGGEAAVIATTPAVGSPDSSRPVVVPATPEILPRKANVSQPGDPGRIPAVAAAPLITAYGLPLPELRPPPLASASPGRSRAGLADARGANRVAEGGTTDTLTFSTRSFSPAGLVHDAVSNRFIIADRDERRLSVIGAQSRRLSNLAGAESAGFGEITALAIDTREGDLWVISESEERPSARLHRLQLISGRLLHAVTLPEEFEPARFADVAMAPGSGVLVLDARGRRIFRVPPNTREFSAATAVDRDGLVSIAPVSASVAFVAHAAGIARVNLPSGSTRELKAPANLSFGELEWIRYRRGSLFAVQKTAEGRHRIVKFELDAAGRAITGETALGPEITMDRPPPVVISGDALYYLAETPAPDFSGAIEVIVRRIALK